MTIVMLPPGLPATGSPTTAPAPPDEDQRDREPLLSAWVTDPSGRLVLRWATTR